MSDRDMVRQVYGEPMASGIKRWLVAIPALVGIGLGGFALYRTANQTEISCVTFPEAIDPLSSQHLLPGAPEPNFSTDPPTSGAHQPGTYPTGVVSAPIERSVQVTLLEQGEVLVQYRGVSSTTLTELQAFVDSDADHVTVAPNPGLRSKIVATAWLWKMECRAFDDKALLDFVRDHQPAQPVSA